MRAKGIGLRGPANRKMFLLLEMWSIFHNICNLLQVCRKLPSFLFFLANMRALIGARPLALLMTTPRRGQNIVVNQAKLEAISPYAKRGLCFVGSRKFLVLRLVFCIEVLLPWCPREGWNLPMHLGAVDTKEEAEGSVSFSNIWRYSRVLVVFSDAINGSGKYSKRWCSHLFLTEN